MTRIAVRQPTPGKRYKKAGEPINIGDDACTSMEGCPCVRIVGFIKPEEGSGRTRRYILVRKYQDGDGEFPTGDYLKCLLGPWPVRQA